MGYANVGQIQVGGPYKKDDVKTQRHAEPARHFHLRAQGRFRRTSLCQQDSRQDGSAGLSAACDGSGCPDAGRSSSTRGGRQGKTFEAGIQFALERMLVDPDFLLRVIREPAKTACFGCHIL